MLGISVRNGKIIFTINTFQIKPEELTLDTEEKLLCQSEQQKGDAENFYRHLGGNEERNQFLNFLGRKQLLTVM